jgi:membrane fusion protein (multidrug efflux system)
MKTEIDEHSAVPRTVQSRDLNFSGLQCYGSNWVVDSGLKAGDRVIVQGTEKVRPGATVKTVDAQLSPDTAAGAAGAPSAPAATQAATQAAAASSPPAAASAASGA